MSHSIALFALKKKGTGGAKLPGLLFSFIMKRNVSFQLEVRYIMMHYFPSFLFLDTLDSIHRSRFKKKKNLASVCWYWVETKSPSHTFSKISCKCWPLPPSEPDPLTRTLVATEPKWGRGAKSGGGSLGRWVALLQDEGGAGLPFPSNSSSQKTSWVSHLGGQPWISMWKCLLVTQPK